MEPNLSADDLLILRAVAQSGRYATAAAELGLNHTTVSRRITALEKRLGEHLLVRTAGGWELTGLGARAAAAAEQIAAALGGLEGADDGGTGPSGVVRLSATDGMSAYVISPAVARLRRRHPGIRVEIVAATRRASQIRSGLDLEIVVGRPQVHRARAERLGDYRLGLYASRAWIDAHGMPRTMDEVLGHPLVYFIDSMLQVDDLDTPRRILPGMQDAITSTNVFVHVEATRAGGGIGLLPCFMASRHPDLVRILPGEVAERLTYWMVARPETLRQPAVGLVARAVQTAVAEAEDFLLGEAPSPFD
ncbi:LysR family transcriptional regulator [Zafaria sp. Z1313]|uniref:LysR family transcriptional regulator n=1 Tax=unclassified Zafaria TaxID=2828765 RepID=UPI002E7A3075|nr:LysR family transcriptional regulator [Zafaria sp. J156]MEE1622129.1 LysR family transcriptional regulator [Zafaria sp. J156]